MSLLHFFLLHKHTRFSSFFSSFFCVKKSLFRLGKKVPTRAHDDRVFLDGENLGGFGEELSWQMSAAEVAEGTLGRIKIAAALHLGTKVRARMTG